MSNQTTFTDLTPVAIQNMDFLHGNGGSSTSAPPLRTDGYHQNYYVPNPYSNTQTRNNGEGFSSDAGTSNFHYPPSPGIPSVGFPRIPLMKKLEECVKNSELDMFMAGKVMLDGYGNSDPECKETLLEFATKYSTVTLVPPVCFNLRDPNLSIVLGLSNMLTNMIISARMTTVAVVNKHIEVDRTKGFVANIKDTFFNSSEPPFNGEKIILDEFKYRTETAHLQVYHHLFDVLSKSCTNQSEIQTGWILPGDKFTKSPSTKPFPASFYNDLRKLFLQFLDLDYNELDAPYWSDAFLGLPFLRNLDDINAKKNMFKRLQLARQVFVTTSFHAQLKSALYSLTTATFVPSSSQSSTGTFKLRDRNAKRAAKKSKLDNVVSPSEESLIPQ